MRRRKQPEAWISTSACASAPSCWSWTDRHPTGSIPVPELRLTRCNDQPMRPDRNYVLYWMVANRRSRYNFALQHAAQEAERLGRPLVVLEALRVGYRWASTRLHRFVLDGMVDNAVRFQAVGVTYLPYVEPAAGAGSGLLETLSSSVCLVVTDEFPCFSLPRMVAATAKRLEAAQG